MFQLDDRRGLDVRADALERALGVGAGCRTIGGPFGGSLDRAAGDRVSRGVRLISTVRLAGCVRDARAVRDT
jgi:hypothetical protein